MEYQETWVRLDLWVLMGQRVHLDPQVSKVQLVLPVHLVHSDLLVHLETLVYSDHREPLGLPDSQVLEAQQEGQVQLERQGPRVR